MTVILQDDHLATEAWASCGHIWTLSYMRLCGLVVDHRRAGAKDLRFASLMGTCNFLSFSTLVTWRKWNQLSVKFPYSQLSSVMVLSLHNMSLLHAHTHILTHKRHVNVTHVTFILSSRELRLQVNYAIRMSWSVHIMSFWGVRFISSTF